MCGCGRLYGFFLLGLFSVNVRQSVRPSDRARWINLYERLRIVYFSFYLSASRTTIWQSSQPIESKRMQKISAFYILIHTQHHDAAIWSRIFVKWSLLFRYCCVFIVVIVCGCAHSRSFMCLPLSLSTCWTGSTNYTYYCQRESVQTRCFKMNERDRKKNERKRNHKCPWFLKKWSAIKRRWSLNLYFFFLSACMRKFPSNK